MGLGGYTGNGGILNPRSITLVQQDPLPDLPPSASAGARLASLAKAILLVQSPIPMPGKWRADVTPSQTISKSLSITKHPVETGFKISDNAIRNPVVVSFKGVISDTPIALLAQTTTLFNSRALDAKTKLDEWYDARELIFVASSLGVFPDMILTKCDITRDDTSGGAIEFDLVLEELKIGSSSIANALIDDDAINLGAGPGTNAGTLPAIPVG